MGPFRLPESDAAGGIFISTKNAPLAGGETVCQ